MSSAKAPGDRLWGEKWCLVCKCYHAPQTAPCRRTTTLVNFTGIEPQELAALADEGKGER